MESLFLLIPLALLSTGIALKAFFWAVANRQFDDLDQAGRGILFDAERVRAAKLFRENPSKAARIESV
jgi:cbb3-type cytochrome oxidase maturation protein